MRNLQSAKAMDPMLKAGTKRQTLLCLNTGSSSLKITLYDASDWPRLPIQEGREDVSPQAVAEGSAEKIGIQGSRLKIKRGGQWVLEREVFLPTYEQALRELLACVHEDERSALVACVHRIVHGGPNLTEPVAVDPTVRNELQRLVELAPLHLPSELAVLDAVTRAYPEIPQIACFDTAFHQRMPALAKRLPLPRAWGQRGVRRYGFHGLSYESIVSRLGEQISGRTIIAHLGNGCSLVALKDGIPQDTTMGLTPTGGLVMGSRSGDLDPGVLFYLLRSGALPGLSSSIGPSSVISLVESLLNRDSGLLGVSESSRNMEDLLRVEQTSLPAQEAIELFRYTAQKFIGALATVLGGLDHLVFTGGIGENSTILRARICQGLEFLGIEIDLEKNKSHPSLVSKEDSPCLIHTLRTDENQVMALHAYRLLQRLRNSFL